jgi:hypothetical protein
MSSVFNSLNSTLIEFDDAGAITEPRPSSDANLRRLLARYELSGDLGRIPPDRLEHMQQLAGQQVEVLKQQQDLSALSICLGNQALILQAQGDLEGAMRLLKEKETIRRRLNDPNGLALSLTNQSVLLAFNLQRPADALPLVQQAHDLADRHGLIALRQQIAPILARIRSLVGDAH